MIHVNMNDRCRIKLTKFGQELVKKRNEPIRKPDFEGYVEIQLWEVMNVFGADLYMGCQLPFETNFIILKEDERKNADLVEIDEALGEKK